MPSSLPGLWSAGLCHYQVSSCAGGDWTASCLWPSLLEDVHNLYPNCVVPGLLPLKGLPEGGAVALGARNPVTLASLLFAN